MTYDPNNIVSPEDRKLLSEAYLEPIGEGPYPIYAKAALENSNSFTMVALRAIAHARMFAQQQEPDAEEQAFHVLNAIMRHCHEYTQIYGYIPNRLQVGKYIYECLFKESCFITASYVTKALFCNQDLGDVEYCGELFGLQVFTSVKYAPDYINAFATHNKV